MVNQNSVWKLLVGQKVNGVYNLKKLLGAGGFGGVFLADEIIDTRLIRQVAVKIIVADGTQRQLDELVAATNLNHPNLLSAFTGGKCHIQGTNFLYLVMELADGSLDRELERRKFSSSEVKQLIRDITSVLEYLHSKKRPVVHRDLKPANILKKETTWKLSDLGLVREVGNGTHSHTAQIAGTLVYMPPEAFAGEVSPAWDIWSLGILIVEVLTGKLPANLVNRTQEEVMRQIVHHEPQIPSLPAPWDRIVRGCLTKDRKARWSASQVLQALSSSSWLSLPNWQNFKPLAIWGGVAVGAIAIFSSSFSLTRNLSGATNQNPNSPAPLSARCVAKTNQIFHQRHPELNGRSIRKDEGNLAQEWREITNSLEDCSQTTVARARTSCIAEANQIFHQRHPELNGRSIRKDEEDLAQEWREIRNSLEGC